MIPNIHTTEACPPGVAFLVPAVPQRRDYSSEVRYREAVRAWERNIWQIKLGTS